VNTAFKESKCKWNHFFDPGVKGTGKWRKNGEQLEKIEKIIINCCSTPQGWIFHFIKVWNGWTPSTHSYLGVG
jgi:hypothetical protein